jgi:hypothetical protein
MSTLSGNEQWMRETERAGVRESSAGWLVGCPARHFISIAKEAERAHRQGEGRCEAANKIEANFKTRPCFMSCQQLCQLLGLVAVDSAAIFLDFNARRPLQTR